MTEPQIRWLIRRDMPEVMEIDTSMPDQWSEEEYLTHLRQRNCIGTVVEHKGAIVGFGLYFLFQEALQIVRMGVHPGFRRQGFGTAFLNRMKDKLLQQRRRQVWLDVPEDNLAAHLFLRSQDFQAIQTTADGYRFSHHVNGHKPQVRPSIPLRLRTPHQRPRTLATWKDSDDFDNDDYTEAM